MRASLVAVLACLLACDSSGPADADAGSDAAALDATVNDVTSDAATDSSLDASDSGVGLSASFFSMTFSSVGNVPSVPFAGIRLWDTSAVWPNLNASNGNYDFAALDAWLAVADKQGADVMFTFGRTPPWASLRPHETCGYGDDSGCAAPPSDIASGDTILKNFVTALVKHSLSSSTAHIKFYEIWNEPDLSITWTGTPSQLVTIAQDISTIVHALDPTALVVGPSPSTGNQFGIHFLPAYYDAGGAPYDDIVGMHAYVYTGSNFATVPEGIGDTIAQLKLLMAAHDAGTKPIFFTEGSWGGPPNNAAMTNDEKVAYLARDHLVMWMNDVARFYWYAWDNTSWGTLWNGAIEPTGIAYGILESWLVGSTHAANPCAKDGIATWSCTIERASSEPAIIAWNATTTATLGVAANFVHYETLDDTTVHAIANNTVSVGSKPILITQ